ncbi:RES family NAD+ phosphorylase [Streptomyces sp. NPDC005859]|uniref:RES family NAD+ phosphorylase n=1 Tax=Streptomyces sp. NPDC005859 TaxID=3157170 RepID=UPI003402D5C4
MPNSRPPAALPAAPAKVTLPGGTDLFRLHSATRSGLDFNPRPAHPFYGGGRFDATALDDYGYLYAGLTPAAVVCESLLRSVPFDPDGGPRLLPRAAVRGKALSFLRLAADVTVLPLVTGRDLAAVAQDAWLVQTEAAEYPFTRHWGHWIRTHTAPWAQGFLWPSKREPAERVAVLFADRLPAAALADHGLPPLALDSPDGGEWLNSVLEPYATRMAPL